MTHEDAKDLTLSVLVVIAVLLVADCIWLHVKCERQAEMLREQAAELSVLRKQLEAHLNPPPLSDRVKEAYEKAKVATREQYEKAKMATKEKYEQVKDATKEQYEKVLDATKEGYEKAKAAFNAED